MFPLGKRKGDNFLQPTVKSGGLRRKKGKKKSVIQILINELW